MYAPLARPVPLKRGVVALAAALAVAVSARPARAQSGAHPPIQGFDVLASAGWGASTAPIGDLELAPYGASFGDDVGYTWPVGFRLAAHFDASLGRRVLEERDVRRGRDF